MTVELDTAVAAKQAIQADADATQKRMDSANKLIGALGGEYTRWKADSEAFADEIRRMAGDVACACAFVSYAGPFNNEFRQILLDKKFYSDCVEKGIPVTKDLVVTKFMVDEGTIGDWANEGLPSDELSVQNGIMVTRSSKWPLLIDPQGQGRAWIIKRDEVNSLRVTSLTDKRFRIMLEDAMSFGQPLLLENVEEVLDPILDPILDKQVQKAGRALKKVRKLERHVDAAKKASFAREFAAAVQEYTHALEAAEALCARQGLDPESLHIWLDYHSIPQENTTTKRLAIGSIALYAACSHYFLACAPEALHQDSRPPCKVDADTYLQRGWCRLEQWAFMAINGSAQMYVFDSSLSQLSSRRRWIEESVNVFNGHFTHEADKALLVDVVLGLAEQVGGGDLRIGVARDLAVVEVVAADEEAREIGRAHV